MGIAAPVMQWGTGPFFPSGELKQSVSFFLFPLGLILS